MTPGHHLYRLIPALICAAIITIDATALACQLLGIDHASACVVIAKLMNSKPDDIITPHAWD